MSLSMWQRTQCGALVGGPLALGGCRGAMKAEGHLSELVEPTWGGKDCLFFQVWVKQDLPVTLGELKGCYVLDLSESIKQLIDPGHWVLVCIEFRCCTDLLKVSAEVEGPAWSCLGPTQWGCAIRSATSQ